jgi:hypothetical protein
VSSSTTIAAQPLENDGAELLRLLERTPADIDRVQLTLWIGAPSSAR